MDPVERRRSQNRMAQRRFRSKKASESVKKTTSGTSSITTKDDTTTKGNATFIPYSSTNGRKTNSTSTTATLSDEPETESESIHGPPPLASTNLLNSLPENFQDTLLPNDHDDFTAATSSMADFVHQRTNQAMSLSLPTRSSTVQGAHLIKPDDFSYIVSGLSDKLRDPLPLRSDHNMHTTHAFNDSPHETFYAQPSGLSSDQLTPSSLQDSSETGSVALSAASYQIEFCQDCSALRIRSPPQGSMGDISQQSLLASNNDKQNTSGTRKNPNNSNDCNTGDSFESSLHIAAESGHSDLIDMLVRSGSIVDEFDSEGNTPLHRAADRKNLHVIQRLLCHGADPNLINAAGRTPVHIAVSTGSMEIVETMIRFGGDLNRRARRKSNRIDSKHGDSDET